MSTSARTVVELWPSADDLAAEVGATPSAVRKWAQRGSIPGEYWAPLADAAERRGFGHVTVHFLARMHARPVIEAAEARA